MSNLVIMEDIKHKFMWNTIIDIFKKVRNKELKCTPSIRDGYNFEYCITDLNTEKEITLEFSGIHSVIYLKELICNKIFNMSSYMHNYCYLCEYVVKIKGKSCLDCPAKTKTSVHKNSDRHICLNGYFTMVNTFDFKSVCSIEQDIFDMIIYCCEKIRDVEYKEGVILRSQFDGMTKKIDKFQIKSFDKVLVRNFDHEKWCATFFSHCDCTSDHVERPYFCIDGIGYMQCISYEGNEYLVGTTNVSE